eukprot:s2046_g10.t3
MLLRRLLRRLDPKRVPPPGDWFSIGPNQAHPTPLRLPVAPAEPAAVPVVPVVPANETPRRLPSAESAGEPAADVVPETAPRSRRKSRTYSKMSSFVPEEPDELDDIADMWRYYAFVAEKQVQTRTRRMVEEATVADDQKVQVPTRRHGERTRQTFGQQKGENL